MIITQIHSITRSSKECPFCKGSHLRNFLACEKRSMGSGLQFTVVECRDCSVAWQLPLATELQQSVKVFDQRYSANEANYLTDRRRAISKLQMNFINKLRKTPGTLLDIGAGMGFFVNEASLRGWNATGIEPSSQGVKQATVLSNKGRIINGVVEELPLDMTFDVITLWDVIEHVSDPLMLIKQSKMRLNPGGWLVIETGNYQSATRIEMGQSWYLWKEDHYWYLAPGVIESLFHQTGLNKTVHAGAMFRPGFNFVPYSGPSLLDHMKKLVRKPWRMNQIARQYLDLHKAYHNWPDWASIEIFTIAGQNIE